MNNENNISTSIQYQISNVKLFYEVFANWEIFNGKLNQGPEAMKNYLLEMWNNLKNELRNNEKLIIKDVDKEVSISDFDVTYNKTKNGTSVFFITFPDYNYTDAASKYVALALTPNMPKYYTLEYSEHAVDHSPCWVVGEWVVENTKTKHINHGTADNMRLTWFSGYIIGKLESENL